MTLFGITFAASDLWPLLIPLVALLPLPVILIRQRRIDRPRDAANQAMAESIALGYRKIDTAMNLVRQANAGQFSPSGKIVEIGDGYYVVNDGTERVVFLQPDQAAQQLEELTRSTQRQIEDSARIAGEMHERVMASLGGPRDEKRTLH